MITHIWRLITLILTALNPGMAFCHVLELPARMWHNYARYRIDQPAASNQP